jgi:beta-alanine--pyruvate transaminase
VGVDHLRHTHDPARSACSIDPTEHGADLADDLGLFALRHTIAAVIVEPVAGSRRSAGACSAGYSQLTATNLRCHGILLIDEVITGFGRTGRFAAQTFGVTPDLMALAGPDQRQRADGRGGGQTPDS